MGVEGAQGPDFRIQGSDVIPDPGSFARGWGGDGDGCGLEGAQKGKVTSNPHLSCTWACLLHAKLNCMHPHIRFKGGKGFSTLALICKSNPCCKPSRPGTHPPLKLQGPKKQPRCVALAALHRGDAARSRRRTAPGLGARCTRARAADGLCACVCVCLCACTGPCLQQLFSRD